MANKKLNEINDSRFFIVSVCPICNKEFDEPPAISRKDNKTEICSDCAIGEAMKAFFDSYKK